MDGIHGNVIEKYRFIEKITKLLLCISKYFFCSMAYCRNEVKVNHIRDAHWFGNLYKKYSAVYLEYHP